MNIDTNATTIVLIDERHHELDQREAALGEWARMAQSRVL